MLAFYNSDDAIAWPDRSFSGSKLSQMTHPSYRSRIISIIPVAYTLRPLTKDEKAQRCGMLVSGVALRDLPTVLRQPDDPSGLVVTVDPVSVIE